MSFDLREESGFT